MSIWSNRGGFPSHINNTLIPLMNHALIAQGIYKLQIRFLIIRQEDVRGRRWKRKTEPDTLRGRQVKKNP
ncbi:hypothetical protein E2C01_036441 [Portunus trituberculatus]|uniref:Uncharacterized protein n=1 Tax=Portunus trituberculatus TaxID=210409 RepID=A0A5B7F5Q0_PORTR|nr:hypothetical protein [Portunus trituberculatus]